MKTIFTFFQILFLSVLFNCTINAQALFTEDFNYTGAVLGHNGWVNPGGSATAPLTVTGTTGLSYISTNTYAGSGVGGLVVLTTNGQDLMSPLSSAVTTGSVYASAMINVSAAQATGDYFFHFTDAGTSNFFCKAHIRLDGSGFDFGISKQKNSSVTDVSAPKWTSGYSFGTTHLIVLKYTFVAGTGADQVALFVDPVIGAGEPGTPTLGPTTDNGNTSQASTSTGIKDIQIRQGNATYGPQLQIDGIRVGLSWTDVTPAAVGSVSFSIIGTLTSFSQNSAVPSAEQTYNIIGTGETANVTVVPPLGFEISKTTGAGFVNSTGSLVFTPADVIAGKTIYVRMNTSTPGINSGNITHTSAGSEFTAKTQPVSGTYTPPCVLSLTELIQARFNGSIMVPDSVTVELHDASSYALVDHDKELLSNSGTGTFTFSNAVNGTNYYIAVKHRNSIETWSASTHSFTAYALSYNFTTAITQAYGSNLILLTGKYCIFSGDVNQDGFVTSNDFTGIDNDASQGDYHLVNDLNGDGFVTSSDFTSIDNNSSTGVSKIVPSQVIPTPVFSITGTLTSFTQTSSTPSAEQTFNISGTSLTANVTVVPPAGFEISKTTGSGFVTSSGSLVYTPANVMAGQTIYVRLHAGSAGGYSGNITHTSANSEFTQAAQSASGTYTATPVFTITASLTSFSQTSSTPSAEQTYSISGTSLTANVTVVPPAGFEISKTTGSGFVNSTGSLVYTAANVMAGQTIYVRLNAGSSGSYSGNITHTSANSEFTAQTVAVSGLYSVISTNVNLIMGYPAPATTDVNNPHAFLLAKAVFCASYDRDRGIPNWTSWQLNSTWCNGPGVRQDNYIPDPSLPASWYHVSGTDYTGSGFSRGHMCPSADRINTQLDNDSLFYYTNMIPQNQDNNAGDWEGLENYERTLANAGNTLYIISGGYGSGGKTQAGVLTTSLSGGKVIVPAQLWKVIIVIPNGDGTAADVSKVTTSTRTIGMMFNNDSVANSTSTWGNYRVSVASIEALTGYTFFSNVPSAIGNVIKANVDTGPTN